MVPLSACILITSDINSLGEVESGSNTLFTSVRAQDSQGLICKNTSRNKSFCFVPQSLSLALKQYFKINVELV